MLKTLYAHHHLHRYLDFYTIVPGTILESNIHEKTTHRIGKVRKLVTLKLLATGDVIFYYRNMEKDLVAAAKYPDQKYQMALFGPRVSYFVWHQYFARLGKMSCNTKCNAILASYGS